MHSRHLIFKRTLTLLAILLAAFGFRIYEITNQSLWFAELATASSMLYPPLIAPLR